MPCPPRTPDIDGPDIEDINRAMRKLLLLITALVICASHATAQQPDASLDKLLARGLDLFDRGQYPQAQKAFMDLLRRSPSQQDILRLRQSAGDSKLLRVMEKGGQFETFARRLMSSSTATLSRPLIPEDKMRVMVRQVIEGSDRAAREKAFTSLDSRGGERSVPHFILHLKSGGASRSRAVDTLRRLGPQVVLPLIELLHSSDSSLVEAAAQALGGIADRRAAADLKWAAETTRGKGASAAAQALTRIASGTAKSAFGLYVTLGRGYYQERPWTMVEAIDRSQYWAWEGGTLKGYHIPPYLFGLFQAERALLRSLVMRPDNAEAWVLYVSTLYAQYARVQDVLSGALSRKGASFTRTQLAGARKNQQVLSRHLSLAHSAGAQVIYSALGRSLAEGRMDVARMACRGLAQVVKHGSEPGAELFAALRQQDERVKYNAARTLVLIDPKEPISQASNVIRVLEATVGQSSKPVALIVTPNFPVLNQLSYLLRTSEKMVVFKASTRKKGLQFAGQWPTEDLIIIDAHLGGSPDAQVAKDLIDIILLNPQMARIPIFGIVKPTDPGHVRAIFKDRVIVLPLKPKVYLPKLRRELQRTMGGFKLAADKTAAEAAQALATIAPDHSIFDLSLAQKGLIKALKREDAVRMPALRALARLATPSAIGPLTLLLRDRKNNPMARAEAARAIGMALAKSGEPPSVETLEALTRAMRDAKKAVQEQAGLALGKANLTVKQRRKLLLRLRLQSSELRKK